MPVFSQGPEHGNLRTTFDRQRKCPITLHPNSHHPANDREAVVVIRASSSPDEEPERAFLEDQPRGRMAGVAGLEPVTSAVTGQRSNQLSYTPANREARQYACRF